MGTVEAERLQQEINESLLARGITWLRITLDHDADVLDLTSSVDIRVAMGTDARLRDFAIRSYRGLERLLHDERLGRSGLDGDLHYCVGGPLGIVKEISGRSIVAVVFHYLCQEHGGIHNLPPCKRLTD